MDASELKCFRNKDQNWNDTVLDILVISTRRLECDWIIRCMV